MNICVSSNCISPSNQMGEASLLQIQSHMIQPVQPKWNRLLLEWNEIKSDRILTHQYAPVVRLDTQEFYVDCRPQKIFAKCLAILLARPAFTVLKTVYHLSLIEVPYHLFKATIHEQSFKEAFIKSGRAIADVVLTPLYGIAMTVSTLAVIILIAINPENAYDGREFLGRLEQQSNWGEKHTDWTLGACFQGYPLHFIETKYNKYCHQDTYYPNIDSLEIGMTNFCRAAISHRRKNYNPFDQLCGSLDPEIAYKSKILDS